MEEIGSRLVQKGHRFDIFVRKRYMGKEGPRRFKGVGLPLSPGVYSKHLDALSHSTSALARVLSRDYNILYINSVGLSVLALLPKVLGLGTVVHTHGLDWKREKWGPLARRLIRMSGWTSVRFPHLTFCVCREDKRFLEGTYGTRCIYVPNGIPKIVFARPERIRQWGLGGGDYLLFMARLVPEKGAHFLLEAWQRLPRECKGGKKLVIAGDSNHRDEYYRRLMDFGGAGDIVFTGFARDRIKAELFSNAFCFVQPSTVEGMPLSVLEAMGYGRMILASDIQENKDLLSGHGWTFQSGNVDDLSSKLMKILQLDRDAADRSGREIREFGLRSYDWDRITDKVERHLIELLRINTRGE